jgi:hypothetical protein
MDGAPVLPVVFWFVPFAVFGVVPLALSELMLPGAVAAPVVRFDVPAPTPPTLVDAAPTPLVVEACGAGSRVPSAFTVVVDPPIAAEGPAPVVTVD